jgi:hypothetical protein
MNEKQYIRRPLVRKTLIRSYSTSARYMIFLSLLCTSLCVTSGYGQNPGDSVFAGIHVHTINLRFSQPYYWDSLTIYYHQGNEQLMAVTAVIDSVPYAAVGVRLKGNSSFTYPTKKKSFKIEFDTYLTDLRWDGMKAVHLNNMWGDPSFMREKMHLDFCRDAGIAAPRANYVRLSINDTLWGLYSLVEHVDKTFLTTRYNNKKGDLFKAVDGFDSLGTAIISDFCWYGKGDSLYTSHYELKTDGSTTAWPALIGFIDTLNNVANTAAVLPTKVNLSSVYKVLGADILFANLDSYINSGRNFYVYFLPSNGKMEWIVWDVGLSFGAYAVGVSKLETMNVLYVVRSTDRPFAGKIFNTPELKKAYLQTLNILFANYFTSARLFSHIDSIANIIRLYVNEDPLKMYTSLQFETNITSDINADGGGGMRKPGLKSFITARQASVQSQLTSLGGTGIYETKGSVPSTFSLDQNYPNPFNPTTTISFSLPWQSKVRLDVFNLLGEHVATLIHEQRSAGSHSVIFNASSLSSGLYFYTLHAGTFSSTRKLILLK